MPINTAGQQTISKKVNSNFLGFLKQLELQSMVWPALILLVIFSYIPMYSVIIAFKNYDLFLGVSGSPWAGLQHFREFLLDENFLKVVRNTLGINVLGLMVCFPAPILFALLLNEIYNLKFKKFVQTVSYLPYFISWVIFGGLVITMLSPSNGAVNVLLVKLGILDKPVNFMSKAELFWVIQVLANMFKNIGWSAIIYIAAISSIDQEMYQAATIDGANRFQKIYYVTLPSIMGTMVILFIFAISKVLNTGFEQIYILQNPLNLPFSETIDTYVYKLGLGQLRFSYATAVGLFRSVIAVILLTVANYLSVKITEKGLY